MQTETLVQTVHQVIHSIRNENLLGRAYSRIALVGFSIGAIVSNAIADKFPEDADSMVRLGVSWDLAWIYPAFLAGLQTAASQVDPGRWGDLEAWYQTQPSLASRRAACFRGEFDEEALLVDYETRDTDTLGLAITFTHHLVAAPRYRGLVFLGIGEYDSTFCPGRCGSQPYEVYDRFPKAAEHVVRVYENTGHAVLHHHAGPSFMKDALDFLDGS